MDMTSGTSRTSSTPPPRPLLAVCGIGDDADLSARQSAVLAGIYAEAALHQANVALILYDASDNRATGSETRPSRFRVDGVIQLVGGGLGIFAIPAVNVPRVVITSAPDLSGLTTVGADYRAAALAVARELRDHGHRRIGYVGPLIDGKPTGDRRDAIGEALPVDGYHQAVSEPFDAVDGRRAALDLLSRPDRPTALLCSDSRLALGVYQAAGELGLVIPEDLSVIAFDDDDSSVADYLRPAMTIVRVPHTELGREAVRLVIAALNRPGSPSFTVQLTCPLERRGSVGVRGST
jgi:LacI family transcriptional regulator